MSLVYKTKRKKKKKFSCSKEGSRIRKIFLVERIMKYWNKLPAEIVMSPTPVIFKMTKTSLDQCSPRLTTLYLENLHLPTNSISL